MFLIIHKRPTVVMITFLAATLFLPTIANSGVFRERDRFNVQANGFWMKGRCVTPTEFSGSAFRDAGCIVKNRKGKRRPGKRNRNVDIRNLYFGFIDTSAGRRWSSFFGPGAECRNTRRCNSKRFADYSTEERGFKILGSLNCIIGWGNDRSAATAFMAVTGRVPSSMDESVRLEIERFERNCN